MKAIKVALILGAVIAIPLLLIHVVLLLIQLGLFIDRVAFQGGGGNPGGGTAP